jgi:CRISPR-associated protein Cmx8
MAKTKTQPDSVEIRYDLYELPTAQHKAGLAGLLMQIDSMQERKDAGIFASDFELPAVVERQPTSVTIRLSEKTVLNLFNDLYDAEVVEQARKQKAKKKEPKAIIEVDAKDATTGRIKKEKRYVYDAIRPMGSFLSRFFDDGKASWLKLWRDMLFAIPRNQDATLGPFKDMAQLRLARSDPSDWPRMEVTRRKNDTYCYLYCREGLSIWADLVRFEEARSRGYLKPTALSGALLLGVQTSNAEALACDDRIDHAILLHFWPLAVRIFVPELIDAEGKGDFVGYVVAVPEVGNLTEFCKAYRRMLGEFKRKLHRYRPAEAVISLPAQGSLEFMYRLAELAERKVIAESPARYLAGVEYFHMNRVGNNVKTMAHGRVPPHDNLLRLYEGVVKSYHNIIFQSNYLLAVMKGQPWYTELFGPMVERDWYFFVHSTQERHRTPSSMVGFAWEVNQRFQRIKQKHRVLEGEEMVDATAAPDLVDHLIYDMVRRYVRTLACEKAGVKEEDPESWMKTAEERRAVCSKLFLEIRSRDGEDFVRHFTATFGSVPQWLDEERYLVIASALMRAHADDICDQRPRTRDDVKTLTLLALSAHSRSIRASKEANGADEDSNDEEDDQ